MYLVTAVLNDLQTQYRLLNKKCEVLQGGVGWLVGPETLQRCTRSQESWQSWKSEVENFWGHVKNDAGPAIAQSRHWQLDYAQQCKPLRAINLSSWCESLRAINLSELGATNYTLLILRSRVQRSWPQAGRDLRVRLCSPLVSEYRAFINSKDGVLFNYFLTRTI